ncbi:MAG: HAD family phosphatase [Christensenellaceae bacterium]|nr:HAD family phosphatase [Christensenellaceae bacterium]MEA5065465.1 HAD family phosphatase [Eubacteriales bacterium]MEA5068117.1 HAD family phosphatase [Christensenellaceae bacterium]
MLEGVIFDFNGTLFWDSDKNERAWRAFARKYTGRDVPDEAFERLHGVPNGPTIAYLLGRTPPDDEVRALSREKEAIYYEACLNDPDGMRLAPGAERMLTEMERLSVPRAIATSADIDNVNFYFEHLGLERWFARERVVYPDGTMRGKPAPDCFLEAARRLALAPSKVAVVEDSSTGIEAARAAGVGRLIGIASGSAAKAGEDVTIIRDFFGWREWFYSSARPTGRNAAMRVPRPGQDSASK